jgi:hypothetical protein
MEVAARFVIRAAGRAPSVHNTQPWYFTSHQGIVRLHADPARRLPEQDPFGREMVISCGAALCNLILAVRHLGFGAGVRLLPDIGAPDLLAEVRWGAHVPPARDEELLYRAIGQRHTHLGPFTAGVPPLLAEELRLFARRERANLHVIYDPGRRAELARLVDTAERTQMRSPYVVAERTSWARLSGDARAAADRSGDRCTRWDGPEFAARGLTPGTGRRRRRVPAGPGDPCAVGLVALLSTRDDRKPGWLMAGHALQRLLLHATARGVSAAFHTQPLEVPHIREQIRGEFTGGAYPQMLVRFGRGGLTTPNPRRPVTGTLRLPGPARCAALDATQEKCRRPGAAAGAADDSARRVTGCAAYAAPSRSPKPGAGKRAPARKESSG